jgi:hypothetical protein
VTLDLTSALSAYRSLADAEFSHLRSESNLSRNLGVIIINKDRLLPEIVDGLETS